MHLRGRLVHRITQDDVGQRVSLRTFLPEGGYTDIIGVVESWADGVLTVRRRDDSMVEVPEGVIAASRVVPLVPPRRRGNRP